MTKTAFAKQPYICCYIASQLSYDVFSYKSGKKFWSLL